MIKLIKNFPYDNKYDYIKLHSDRSSQTNYFNSFQHIKIDEGIEEGYVREGETFIIEYNYDYLVSEGVNYVIWNNGFKDLYCFIVNKEYIDEEMTRLHYEIDVLNTYLFDINLNKSYIERKQCAITEVSDYDEGLEMGEHIIEREMTNTDKKFSYYAMFGGIKQQTITFDSNNNISNVVNLPSPTMKPSTMLDDIPYPLYFMELLENYPEPTIEEIQLPTPGGGSGGDWRNGIVSGQGFRFIKGFEGFAPNKYQDSGGYWTIAYGVTAHGEPDIYNDLVNKQPVSETEGAQISYKLKNDNYGKKICNWLVIGGIKQQCQFDALLSLSYNCGIGTITGSGYDSSLWEEIKKDPTDENHIRPLWEKFKVTSGGQQLPGLVARRKEECNMFFNKPFEVRPISTIGSDGNINGTVAENSGNGWLP